MPTLRILAAASGEVEARARAFLSRVEECRPPQSLRGQIVTGESAVGGGSAPDVHPRTALVALTHESLSPGELGKALRLSATPVIARVADGRVLLDLRTVAENEEAELLRVLTSLPG
ncbi:MAG: hypothetical protein LC800_04705 [Acidobacteria bacterium]|nr:hypothetical protein [Acidobacteriota bacterium]